MSWEVGLFEYEGAWMRKQRCSTCMLAALTAQCYKMPEHNEATMNNANSFKIKCEVISTQYTCISPVH